MSDCLSSGLKFEKTMKELNSECTKGKTRKDFKKQHNWIDESYGIRKCKNCGKVVFLT